MTKTIENQEFVKAYDNGGHVYEDLVLRKCKFLSSGVSLAKHPAQRSVVRNVTLERCRVQRSSLGCAVVEDVLVDGLQTPDLLQAFGTIFHRVTLKGKIGRLMVTPVIRPGSLNTPVQEEFDRDREAYYANMDDFALDISQADAVEIALSGIPARLVRRDPETQAVVTRQSALSGEWRELEHVQGSEFKIVIQELLKGSGGTDDAVLIAHRRSRNFKKLLAGIEELRAAGVALPD